MKVFIKKLFIIKKNEQQFKYTGKLLNDESCTEILYNCQKGHLKNVFKRDMGTM